LPSEEWTNIERADRHRERRRKLGRPRGFVCDNGPNTFVSSRKPNDLPSFSRELIETIATGVAARTWLSNDRLRFDSRVIAWVRPVSPRGDVGVDEATTLVEGADVIEIHLV